MTAGGTANFGLERLQDGLSQLRRLQAPRVANPTGALRGWFGPPATDAEQLAALVLAEEAAGLKSRMPSDLRGEVYQRLALTALSRGQLDEAAARLQEGLAAPPPENEKLRAALHYNLFRTLSVRANEDARIGEVAAGHYRHGVTLDATLAEFSLEFTLVRVLSAEAHTALFHVRNAEGTDRLIRALDYPPDDPSVVEMLALEAQALTEWNHPHICRVFEYRHGQGRRPFLVLDHLEGVDLERATRNMLNGGRRPTFGGALFEMRHIFSAVRYLHSQQPSWVLRTLNPRDIFLTRNRGLLLTDFGLNEPSTRAAGDDALYLAPEVLAGRPAGPTCDIYSLARVFCFLVSGGPDLIDGLEPPIAEVLNHAVHPNPEQRFPDIRSFRIALSEACERMTRLTLTATEGPCKGRKYHFDRWQTFTIGRDPNADFSLSPDGRMSRRHVQIEVRPTECRLRDLGSSNGTLINGWPKSEERIFDGDTIQVGDSLLQVDIEYPGQPRKPPEAGQAPSRFGSAESSAEIPILTNQEPGMDAGSPGPHKPSSAPLPPRVLADSAVAASPLWASAGAKAGVSAPSNSALSNSALSNSAEAKPANAANAANASTVSAAGAAPAKPMPTKSTLAKPASAQPMPAKPTPTKPMPAKPASAKPIAPRATPPSLPAAILVDGAEADSDEEIAGDTAYASNSLADTRVNKTDLAQSALSGLDQLPLDAPPETLTDASLADLVNPAEPPPPRRGR